jgi:uncharacterized protein (DUF1499 family)
MIKLLVVILPILVVLGLAYVRFAPNDPAIWHGDPLTAVRTTAGGWLVRPEGGDAPSPVIPGDPADVLAALDRIALATPRTHVLTGTVLTGQVTYVTRSLIMGFPDFTTVTVLPAPGGGSLPVLFARQRFGDGDMGVNRARVESWLAQLAATTP